ncbi:hypothetical protein BDV96DRAFT_339319 [Lophiotrema nucula]|uniref:PD-(D/E)XK nuclease-like domain-containing protein n=1 Tax=Lophiotrema nucula TaxID=690887 RepID=A0A6A5YH54_9PLEO|nr:hypothetical protein BDV96DRAFT_339319 [Lophiotrema nucula]
MLRPRPKDFDRQDDRPADSDELANVWRKVKNIFINARDCKKGNRDENAWCYDVVWPLLLLAIALYGDKRWWLQSVQTQSIESAYLSTVPAPNGKDKAIDRKTDFVLAYSHRHHELSALYERLRAANHDVISHTTDPFTKRTALFSGLEVKPDYGNLTEAELQMSIWMAASLRKKQELATAAGVPYKSLPDLVEPAVAVVGHQHYIYYAFQQDDFVDGQRGVHVLGPESDRFDALKTDSIRGIFRLLRLYGNLLRYGMDEEENGYWGRFFKPVLENMAKSERAGAALSS